MAFLMGRFTVLVPVPVAAMALLPAPHDPLGSGRPVPPPLAISGAVRSETEFWTDRGRRSLPAWRLESDDVKGVISVLDPEAAARAWTTA